MSYVYKQREELSSWIYDKLYAIWDVFLIYSQGPVTTWGYSKFVWHEIWNVHIVPHHAQGGNVLTIWFKDLPCCLNSANSSLILSKFITRFCDWRGCTWVQRLCYAELVLKLILCDVWTSPVPAQQNCTVPESECTPCFFEYGASILLAWAY